MKWVKSLLYQRSPVSNGSPPASLYAQAAESDQIQGQCDLFHVQIRGELIAVDTK